MLHVRTRAVRTLASHHTSRCTVKRASRRVSLVAPVASLLRKTPKSFVETEHTTVCIVGDGDGAGITLSNSEQHAGACRVDGCVPGDRADATGLREGDVILTINGKPVTCRARLRCRSAIIT